MENWIDELDEVTKRYDGELRGGAERYDNEVGKWWQLKTERKTDPVEEDGGKEEDEEDGGKEEDEEDEDEEYDD